MPSDQRFRNFATEIYPDTAFVDWEGQIEQLHVPALLSPLHDRDKFPDGKFKKPHYHLLLMYDGKKSPDQIRAWCGSIGAVGLEIVQSIRGMSRYLCHLDNPEKAQYSPALVKAYSGADYSDLCMSESDKAKALQQLQVYCDKERISSFDDLCVSLRLNKENELFRLANFSCVYSISQYLRAKQEKMKGR